MTGVNKCYCNYNGVNYVRKIQGKGSLFVILT